jgi:tetratricopeptide (TPR) repeat protein
VCPIDCVSDVEEVYFAALALSPLIRRDLFCVQQISVIPTEDTHVQTKPFILKETGIESLGEAHGADIVTSGFLKWDMEKLIIEFQAYDCKNRYFLLKTKVEGKPTKIFELERQLVFQLIDTLGVTLSKEERARLTSNSPKKLKAAVEFGAGLKHERQEKYSEALMAYAHALSDDKYLAVPHAAEARVYAAYNAPLKAMDTYRSAVLKDEFYAEAWYQLNLYAEGYSNDKEMAVEFCKKALAIAPRFGKARLSLGARLYALGDLDGAIEETRKAVQLLSVDPLPCYNLGIYYNEAGQPAEARKWFEQALAINPGFDLALTEIKRLKREHK